MSPETGTGMLGGLEKHTLSLDSGNGSPQPKWVARMPLFLPPSQLLTACSVHIRLSGETIPSQPLAAWGFGEHCFFLALWSPHDAVVCYEEWEWVSGLPHGATTALSDAEVADRVTSDVMDWGAGRGDVSMDL